LLGRGLLRAIVRAKQYAVDLGATSNSLSTQLAVARGAFLPGTCQAGYSIVWLGRPGNAVCSGVIVRRSVYPEPSFSFSCTAKRSVGASSAASRSHTSSSSAKTKNCAPPRTTS
jgi:hypothetical protein